VPYSPVTGPRLLAADSAAAATLRDAIVALVEDNGLSSAHVNFLTEADDAVFGEQWLLRHDVQYHWQRRPEWEDFDSFLASMDHKHRKNIRQERNKVRQAGIGFRTVHGHDARDADLAAMHGFYLKTFSEYGNSPALTLDFLRHLARTMPEALVIFLAELGGEPLAGALCLRGGDTLYGRYWGGATLPGLHFETCYYQGIEYCLREGLARFEPGAQGEHKIARGFLPTEVRSRHWIADPGFREPLAEWCEQERDSVRRYRRELAEHSPFRDDVGH
jgi:predicted N-acyltransferase